ncbi:MAG: hypothetical protein AAF928_18810, partial [Myxococcota bacterium]
MNRTSHFASLSFLLLLIPAAKSDGCLDDEVVIGDDQKEVVEIARDFPLEDWIQQLQKGTYAYYLSASRSTKTYMA